MISATLQRSVKKKIFSGSAGTRTHDIRATSPLLYHLTDQTTDGNRPMILHAHKSFLRQICESCNRCKSCMVTRVSAKTTKARNSFINGNKKFKRRLSCLFGGRRKVQVSRTSSLLSFLLPARSEQRLSSQHFAAVPTPNIAELVPSVFSVYNHGSPNTFSRVKHQHFHVDRHLVTGKEINSKFYLYK